MKATGIVRNVDDLRRVVIPAELCRTFGISAGDPVEFYKDGNMICIKKYHPADDMAFLVEDFERGIRMNDRTLPAEAMDKLLGKVDEMKTILAEIE